MSTSLKVLLIYAIWFAAIFYVHRICKISKSGSVGSPLAYLFTMTFCHIGGLAYAIPGYTHIRPDAHWYLASLDFTEKMVVDGAFASMLCVLGIAVGCRLVLGEQIGPIAPVHFRRPPKPTPPPPLPPQFRRQPPPRTILPLVLMAGSMSGFVLTALNINLPSLQSIILAGRNLATVAVCLGLWLAWQRKDSAAVKFWSVMTLTVPVIYLVGWGFFSYGFTAMSIFLALWLSMPDRTKNSKYFKVVVTTLGIYASFTVFVGYMEVRQALRDVLWSADASLSYRVATVVRELSTVRPLSLFNFHQIDWINIRLNQNMFIGKAMYMHEVYPNLQENGMGILLSLAAWVPRVLWPSKPTTGGNDYVEHHTGMSFADTTTIGAGPVFELFVNFGLVGVFLGSIALGWALRSIDAHTARQLKKQDMGRFIRGLLVCSSLITPYNLLFFFVSSGAASWIVGTGIMYLMEITRLNRHANRPPPRRRPQPGRQTWAS